MWEDLKEFVLFLIAVLSGLGIKDGLLRWMAHERAILLDAELIVSYSSAPGSQTRATPEKLWPAEVNETIDCCLRITSMNNSLERIVITEVVVEHSGGVREPLADSQKGTIPTVLEARGIPVSWSHSVRLKDAAELEYVLLFEPYGKMRKLHSKRIRELRAEAQNYLRIQQTIRESMEQSH